MTSIVESSSSPFRLKNISQLQETSRVLWVDLGEPSKYLYIRTLYDMEEIDELDPNEVIRNIEVDGVDVNNKKLPQTLIDWDRLDRESHEKRKKWKKIFEDYDNGRLGLDDDNSVPIIPNVPKPPLNLGGYRKLEDEDDLNSPVK